MVPDDDMAARGEGRARQSKEILVLSLFGGKGVSRADEVDEIWVGETPQGELACVMYACVCFVFCVFDA